MHDTRYRKPQVPAEFLCFHVGLHWDQHWRCACIQEEYGTDDASPRTGSLLGFPHTEVEQGCCCHPQEVQPPPSMPAAYPRCRAGRGTSLQTHPPAAPCCSHQPPFGHIQGLQLCPAVWSCPTPLLWTPMLFPWEVRHFLTADHPSTGREPCRAAKHFTWAQPFGSFCLWQQTIMIGILCAQVDAKGKSLSNSSPGKKEWNFLPSVWTNSFRGYCKFQQ